MNDLNRNNYLEEYFRIMEKRIHYYADKYDKNRSYCIENNAIMKSKSQPGKRNKKRSMLKYLAALTIS